jgi:hypothetical protein
VSGFDFWVDVYLDIFTAGLQTAQGHWLPIWEYMLPPTMAIMVIAVVYRCRAIKKLVPVLAIYSGWGGLNAGDYENCSSIR